jgi:hypothetical protein
MAQQLLELDARGVTHAQEVLSRYLPGFDPGLTVISARLVVLPETTLLALKHAYGTTDRQAVLRQAGVTARRELADMEALELLLRREPGAQPARPAAAGVTPGWHLDDVRVQAAWDLWGGPLAIDWGAVRVGQVDTGYTAHHALGFPQGGWVDTLQARTFFAPGAGTGGAGPGGGLDPLEDQMDGHGTRVASVICGHDATAAAGPYLGVAPRVPLVPVRIANHVLISHAQRELAQALRHLVRTCQVSVINLSMGFLPRLQMRELDHAIDEAYEAGVIFVCAAGQPLASVVSPAHGRRTVAVAGSTVGGIPWGSSAHGSAVDWSAPAAGIHRAEASAGGADYAGGGDGTSYAAAITTGAAALWLAHHGAQLDATYPQPWQKVEAFKWVAKATARPMPNQQPGSFGAGVINIGDLLLHELPPALALVQERPA